MVDQCRARRKAAASSGNGPLRMKWLFPCTKMPTISLQVLGPGLGSVPRRLVGNFELDVIAPVQAVRTFNDFGSRTLLLLTAFAKPRKRKSPGCRRRSICRPR